MTDLDIDAWRAKVRQDLGRDWETLRWRSVDGVEIDPLYVEAAAERGAPGAPPFVRGSEGRREWLLVDEPRGADEAAFLESARRALREGAEALWIGRQSSLRIDAEALAGLGVPVWIEDAPFTAASQTLRVVTDPLGALARGTLSGSIESAFDALSSALEARPESRPILVSGTPYHEGGATAVDELGLMLASGITYLRLLSEAGRPLADLPRRMLFELSLDADFFVGIAKLRAARWLWSKALRAIGIDGPEQGMRIRARSSRRMATTLDPELGILRGTAAAFAAVLGGAQLVTVAPYDELCEPHDPHAERLARRTQHVLREEAELGRVLDPAGGSYFLEALTEKLAREAWGVMQEVDHLGGIVRGLTDGSIAERVQAGRQARQSALATGKLGMVAVNRYPSPGEPCAARASVEPAEKAIGLARDAAPFEALRARAAALPPERRRALVLGIGEARALRPRLDFARDALAVAGLEVEVRSAPTAAEALEGELAPVVAPCASDDDYLEVARATVASLRDRGARAIVLATRPSDALRELGPDAFVHRGADLVGVLGAVLDLLEGT